MYPIEKLARGLTICSTPSWGKKLTNYLILLGKGSHQSAGLCHWSGQIITTSAEVTLNGGLVREFPQNPLNSGLGIILISLDWSWKLFFDDPKFNGTSLSTIVLGSLLG